MPSAASAASTLSASTSSITSTTSTTSTSLPLASATLALVSTTMDQMALTRSPVKLDAFATALVGAGTKMPTLITAVLGIALLSSWRAGLFNYLLQSFKAKREASEPGLFKKYTSFECFTTASGHVYPKIRVFYHTHIQADKLPKNLPLMVFIHGLGGNATQFSPLLTSMVNVAPCLAIDLAGCGSSAFKPNDPRAYTLAASTELVAAAIDKYRDKANNQQVVLVGHSMGCSIAALLASSASKLAVDYIIGMVAICPRSCPFSEQEAKKIRKLRYIPTLLFDVFRFLDRRGGLQSRSINRAVGEGADNETRRLQERFNSQSRSAPFLRSLNGLLPSEDDASTGLPGRQVWNGLKVPLFLIAGDADVITPPEHVDQIAFWLSRESDTDPDVLAALVEDERRLGIPVGMGPEELAQRNSLTQSANNEAAFMMADNSSDTALQSSKKRHDSTVGKTITNKGSFTIDYVITTKHDVPLKTVVLPEPAAHGLLYATATVRILSGLLESFLSKHVDEHLGLGWQLQHLATSGKWDVKNYAKWRAIDPVSAPIGHIFRAMKTMREVDDSHNPIEFVKQYSHSVLADGVAMVVDISHGSPVYDPKGLEDGGVEYHKFPTVSKLPPTPDEVEHFCSLIDQLRRAAPAGATVAVHCHYGFNRTGLFVVSYLVERAGYTLPAALAEFAEKRPPGIKHEHFVNELHVRYASRMGGK